MYIVRSTTKLTSHSKPQNYKLLTISLNYLGKLIINAENTNT